MESVFIKLQRAPRQFAGLTVRHDLLTAYRARMDGALWALTSTPKSTDDVLANMSHGYFTSKYGPTRGENISILPQNNRVVTFRPRFF